MPDQAKLDNLFMDVSARIAEMSFAERAKVGAILVKDDNIISMGWNGMPSGDDNDCEDLLEDGSLVTKREVLHAENNAISKLAACGGVGSRDGTLYVTLSPCFDCAKLIKQAKIKRVVFRDQYRDSTGIDFLKSRGVTVDQLRKEEK